MAGILPTPRWERAVAPRDRERERASAPVLEAAPEPERPTITDFTISLLASDDELQDFDDALLGFREALGAEERRRTHAGDIAAEGLTGPAGELPHLREVQRAFGRHDVAGVSAHVGGPATQASRRLGATAYATGEDVAFAAAPTLHTAAHEAAHVVQQRGGISLPQGLGSVGDVYERHADAVADAVVQGRSAEALLDAAPTTAGVGGGVQREAAGSPGVGVTLGANGEVDVAPTLSIPVMPRVFVPVYPPGPPNLAGAAGLYLTVQGALTASKGGGLDAEGGFTKYDVSGSVAVGAGVGAATQAAGVELRGEGILTAGGAFQYYPSGGELKAELTLKGSVALTLQLGPLALTKKFRDYELLQVGGPLGTLEAPSFDGVGYRVGQDVGLMAEELGELFLQLGNPLGAVALLGEMGWTYAEDGCGSRRSSWAPSWTPWAPSRAGSETPGAASSKAPGEFAERALLEAQRDNAELVGYYEAVGRGCANEVFCPSAELSVAHERLWAQVMPELHTWLREEMLKGRGGSVEEHLEVPLASLVGAAAPDAMEAALVAAGENDGLWPVGEMTLRRYVDFLWFDKGWLAPTPDPYEKGQAHREEVLARLAELDGR